MTFNEAYMQCALETYETEFRTGCLRRTLDFSGKMTSKQICDADAKTLPGFERLCFADPNVRFHAWTWYFQDLVSYLCGPQQLDLIDIQKEAACYFVPVDPTQEHQLRMVIDADGNLQDAYDWIVEEETAINRLVRVANVLGVDDIVPQQFARV